MNYVDLKAVALGIQSVTSRDTVQDFFARGGVIGYNTPGEGTRYIINESLAKAGVILVDPMDINAMSWQFGSDNLAMRQIITHEMGHFRNQLNDKASAPGPGSTLEERLEYCYAREGAASMYAFTVAKELKALGLTATVPGTNSTPDLFAVMQQAEQIGRYPLTVATRAFASDPKYVAYCRNNDGQVSAWITPDGDVPPPGTDGDGTYDAIPGVNPSGAGMGGGTGVFVTPLNVAPIGPIGSGYWQHVPPEDNDRPEPKWTPTNPADSVDGQITLIAQAELQHLMM